MNSRSETIAVALAGGRSRRMGQDKASVLLEGAPLIDWVTRAAREAGFQTIVVREDHGGNRGPLSGALTALDRAQSPWALLLPCDMPFLPPTLLQDLLRAARPTDLGVFTTLDHRVGFPMALRQASRSHIEHALHSEIRSLQSAFNAPEFRPYWPDEKWVARLQNINTPEDLQNASEFVRKNHLRPPALSGGQSTHEER